MGKNTWGEGESSWGTGLMGLIWPIGQMEMAVAMRAA